MRARLGSSSHIKCLRCRSRLSGSNMRLATASFGTMASKTISSKDFVVKHFKSEVGQSLPSLRHGIDRVLFNPGVSFLKDPRSDVYNFDPKPLRFVKPDDIKMDEISSFTKPSEDEKLHRIAQARNCRFVGSTSSLSGPFSQLHLLLSEFRPTLNVSPMSPFQRKKVKLGNSSLMGASICLIKKGDIYCIDSEKYCEAENNALSSFGHILERQLTLPVKEFEKYKKTSPEKPETIQNVYHYSKAGSILMRSQLDCRDHRLPGGGVFDLKTRASLGIRLNATEHDYYSNYRISTLRGNIESFEREYMDMMRNSFLKYNLQTRIGNMNGILVAYHNTENFFGFQYISKIELDKLLHYNTYTAEKEFSLTLNLFNKVIAKAVQTYPDQHLKLEFIANRGSRPQLFVIVEPMTLDEINTRQEFTYEKLADTVLKGKSYTNAEQIELLVDHILDDIEARDLKSKNISMWEIKGVSIIDNEELFGFPNINKASTEWLYEYELTSHTDFEYMKDIYIEAQLRKIQGTIFINTPLKDLKETSELRVILHKLAGKGLRKSVSGKPPIVYGMTN